MSITGNTQYWGISGQTNVNPRLITDSILTYVDAANSNSFISGSTTWFDLSKNFSNGTRFGTLSSTTQNLGAMYFNGSTNYVNFTKMNKTVLGSNFTISIWYFSIETGNQYSSVFQMGLSISYFQPFINFFTNEQVGEARLVINGTVRIIGNSVFGYWNNATITYDGTEWILYFNGGISGTYVAPIGGVSGGLTTLGTGYAGYFKGYISNFIVYSRALTPTEVLNNFLALKDRYGLIPFGFV